jgi:hypothetical protein
MTLGPNRNDHDPRAESLLELESIAQQGERCPMCGSQDVKDGVCPDPTRPMETADFGCRQCDFLWNDDITLEDIAAGRRVRA